MKTASLLVSFTLSILIMFNSLRISITYAYYELDPIGFIEKLCINKDKPELQCNGNCHLKKVTESNTNNDNNHPTQILDFKEILFFTQEPNAYNLHSIKCSNKVSVAYKNLYAFLGFKSHYRPPKVQLIFNN
ncbi:hypothetical protein L3X37_05885 [Sabulilitoribacter arenilitoris]|uniref:Uncharacterized protein n=1 Tax=Wocania arenilitoris TaxID=2044858 RepID=A0AAE3JP50_9FLAO|nr:hypothetical protein [Wocania arenilitoris]MCF7567895.1 hypothetical protein [Wocania arenilitoris]